MTDPAPLPAPTPDQDSRPYWDGLAEGELRLQRCRDCRRFQHFPAPICSSCWSFDLGFEVVSGRGTIETFVVIEHTTSPAFVGRTPITAAWVELPEQAGLRVLADVIEATAGTVGAPAIRIGTPVELVLDGDAWAPTAERPDPPPLPRFRPITDSDHRLRGSEQMTAYDTQVERFDAQIARYEAEYPPDVRSDVDSVLTWYRGMSSHDATLAMSKFTPDCRYWAVGLQPDGVSLQRYWMTGREAIAEYLSENCKRTKPGKLKYTPLHVGVAGKTVMVECTTDAHFAIGHHYTNQGVYVFDCNDDHDIVEMRPFYDWGPVAAHRAATGWTGTEET